MTNQVPAAPRALEALPAAVYTCAAAGLITYFNGQAANLWGREPRLHDPVDRYCGSFKLFTSEGTPLGGTVDSLHNKRYVRES